MPTFPITTKGDEAITLAPHAAATDGPVRTPLRIWPISPGAGWGAACLRASLEKTVLEAGMPQMMGEPLRLEVVDDEEMALSAQAEVEPGGDLFGAGRTLARVETAFCQPQP